MKTILVGTLVISLFVVIALVTTTHVQAVRSGTEKNDAANRLQQSFGKLSISFEKNQGQADAEVKYLARGSGYGIFLKPHEAVLRLRGKDDKAGYATVQMQFLQSNAAPLLQALEPQTSTSNYFLGNNPRHWQTKVQSFSRVRYQNLYPGIDLIYYGNQQRLEYDFVVAPHANPNKINLNFQGVQTSCLDQNGDLLLQTSNGEIRQLKPQAYQEINGTRQAVAAEYVIDQQRHISFRLGTYDHSQPLIIDPVILYSTFLGGSSNDIGRAIAVGKDGSVYVLGETFSVDFPGTGSLQSSNKGVQDEFVLKMNAAGTKLDYAT